MSTPRPSLALVLLVALLATGGVLRGLWLTADPPTGRAEVGVVWHDEGAWVHNARNKALWGVWRTDEWNPMYLTPVFTGLEYAAFDAFGVGTRQARLVPAASGLLAVLALVAGLWAVSGRRAALVGGWLLATNYVFVMWNRAALMESTMSALIVVSWAAYALASKRGGWWAAVAGLAAVLAWFTKASAAFFLAALAADAVWTLAASRGESQARERRAAWITLAALGAAAAVIGVVFVLPHWTEYRFYNWQMSVTRKPSYGLRDLMIRASWLPVVQGFFTRMWLVLGAACLTIMGVAARWRRARPAERLLVLWVLVGLLELVVHDSGNERRYVMFIPALIALTGLFAGSDAPLFPPALVGAGRRTKWLAVPLLVAVGYLVFGSILRLAFASPIAAGDFHSVVRVSALCAVVGTALIVWQWRWLTRRLSTSRFPALVIIVFVSGSVAWNVWQFGAWAAHRQTANYQASVRVGQLLPPGTLVQGKLANGLDLENRIRPLFIGNGFGNAADRLRRDDVRYILTEVSPALGYETPGGLIPELLARYPDHHAVEVFDVDETGGPDQAALIDKFRARR
jgi:4-amino-4-deoxy-L-arabinose transferase-like glycosyltransferase